MGHQVFTRYLTDSFITVVELEILPLDLCTSVQIWRTRVVPVSHQNIDVNEKETHGLK